MNLNSITNSLRLYTSSFCLAIAMLLTTHQASAEPIEIANTSEPYTAIETISLPDLTGDGFADFGTLYLDSVDDKLRLQIIDGVRLEQDSVIIWNNIYDEPSVHVFPDLNGNNVPEVGMFGVRNDGNNTGKPQMFVRDSSSGQNVRVFNWPANWSEVSPLVLSDMTGDGIPEVAIQGRFKEGNRPQLVIKNGATGAALPTYSYPDLFNLPKFFQHSDVDDDGVSEISTFGRIKRNNKIQVKIASGVDPKDRFKAYNFPDKWSDISWHQLDDMNGDGEAEWGLFGRSKEDGRPQLMVKNGIDPKGALAIYAWPADLQDTKFFRVPDMNSDGIDEVAVGGRRSNGRYQFQIKDGANRNSVLANHNLNLQLEELSFYVLPDLTGDGVVEIGFLGENMSGESELVIQEGNTEYGEYTRYTLGSDWAVAPSFMSIGDTDEDGFTDILTYGQNTSTEDVVFVPLIRANLRPIANAGPDQTVEEKTTVTLSGAGIDRDGSISTYTWLQTSGSQVVLSETNQASIEFIAPDTASRQTLSFELTVTDNNGASNSKEIQIAVTPIMVSFTITGLVTDKIIPNAEVEVLIGENRFFTTANDEGVYSVFIEIDDSLLDSLVKIQAIGSNDDKEVNFISQLSSVRKLIEQAGRDAVLTLDENFSVNITNVTTAEYVLIVRSDNNFPTTDSELESIKSSLSTNEKISLAALIKLVVDNVEIELPAGITNTFDLVSDQVVAGNFAASVDVYLLDLAIDEILNDANLVREFRSWTNDIFDVNFQNCVKRYVDEYAELNNISDTFTAHQLSFITELNCSGMEISQATGLEFLTGLKVLDLSINSLTNIQIHNKFIGRNNKALVTLRLSHNQLSSINIDDNINLSSVDLSHNQLSTLNIKKNTALRWFWARHNKLVYLDVSNNILLEDLKLNDNLLASLNSRNIFQTNLSSSTMLLSLDLSNNQLTNLDVNANTELETLKLSHNLLTTLNTNNNTKLTLLDLSDNQLSSTNIRTLVDLTWFDISNNLITTIYINDNIALTWLDLSENQLSDIDMSDNVSLEWVDVSRNLLTSVRSGGLDNPLVELNLSDNQLTDQALSNSLFLNLNYLTTLDLSKNQLTHIGFEGNETGLAYIIGRAPNLIELDLSQNKINYLELHNNPLLTWLDVSENQLTDIDVSNNNELTWLSLRDNQLTDIDVDNNNKLTYLDVGLNQLTDLVVSNKELLSVLTVDGNKLFNIDASNNPSLPTLNVQQELTNIDVSNDTALKNLYLYNNKLTSIDISTNIALNFLLLSNNLLTTFGVSNNPELKVLHLNNNRLTSVDVSNHTALESLYLFSNKLNSIDVSANIALEYLFLSDNNLTDIDLSYNTELIKLHLSNNLLTSIDVRNNTALTFLSIEGAGHEGDLPNNSIANIDLSNNLALVELDLFGLGLTSIDLTNNVALEYIDLPENRITSFDFTKNILLKDLDLSDNRLNQNDSNPTTDAIDFSNNIALMRLILHGLGLTSIDLTKNVELEYLDLKGNRIEGYDFTENTVIKELYISSGMPTLDLNNPETTDPTLIDIDLSNNIALTHLQINNTPIYELDLSNNTELISLDLSRNFLVHFNSNSNSKLIELKLNNNILSSIDVSNNINLEQLQIYNNFFTSIDVSNIPGLIPGVDEGVIVISP